MILIYDVTDRESFSEIFQYWLDEIETFSEPDSILVILGNKVDLVDEEQVKMEEMRVE